MISQALKLTGAAVLGLASVGVSISAPTLTNLDANDLSAFANGQRVEVTAYRPGRGIAAGLGAAGLGLFGWWLWRELLEGDGTAPIATTPDADEPTGQFIHAPAGVPAPEKYIDVSAILAKRLRPTLVTGNPRIGKGIAVVHGINWVKHARPDCPVWLIQPKYHRKEHPYWDNCDRVLGFMLEDSIGQDDELERIGKEMSQFIFEWRKQAERPTLLVIDELSLLKAVMPKWYKNALIPQLKTEMSSGETDNRALWCVTQSPLSTDIEITRGDRSTFDLLAIENPDSSEHLASLCASYDGVPKIEDPIVFKQSLSPKKAVFYHSSIQQWLPMLPYAVPTGAETPETPVSNPVNPVSNHAEHFSADLLTTTSVASALPDWLDLGLLLRVSNALKEGMSESKIVQDVMGYGGRNYQDGKDRFMQIKAILEEHS